MHHLVFHMREGKFDSVREFIDTGGVLKSLLSGFMLGFIVWRTKRKINRLALKRP